MAPMQITKVSNLNVLKINATETGKTSAMKHYAQIGNYPCF